MENGDDTDDALTLKLLLRTRDIKWDTKDCDIRCHGGNGSRKPHTLQERPLPREMDQAVRTGHLLFFIGI